MDQVYNAIGFNRIPDEILRHLVVARVSQPGSKLATVDYLKSYYDEDIDLNRIYCYMDRLYNTQMELAHMFHFAERRVEAHICICFIAYKVYKELERLIGINKIGMSVGHVFDAAKIITTIRMPENGNYFTKNSSSQKSISPSRLFLNF